MQTQAHQTRKPDFFHVTEREASATRGRAPREPEVLLSTMCAALAPSRPPPGPVLGTKSCV